MKTEVEAKFLNIDHDEIRTALKALGATCVMPMRLMNRAILDYPDLRLQDASSNSYIRIRDEGDKVTLTFKQFKSLSVDGAHEIEVIVDSFEKTVKIFEMIGLQVKSLQESKRETWTFEDFEIVLDEWPWIKPYIEIEGQSEEELIYFVKKLNLDWNKSVFGDVMVAYRAEYSHLLPSDTIGNITEVRFDDPLPDLLKS